MKFIFFDMKIDYMIDHKMNPDAEDGQRCTQCTHTMLMEHFSQNKKGDYFKNCDPCRVKARAYRSKNKEKIKAYGRSYYISNKARLKETCKAYQVANKDKCRAMTKAYRLAHPDRVKAACKAYQVANKDKCRAMTKAYRNANKKKLSAANKDWMIVNKDRHKCDECGYSSPSLSHLCNHLCGSDGMSSGEREVFRVLNDLRIDFDFGGNKVYLPIKEATGRNLKYDFIVRFEDRLLFIEYDGSQHFKAVAHWGGEDALEGIRERDAIKTEFCEDRGYPLLRIPYTKHGMIPSLVVEFMVEYTNWGYE
jgi:hypothetical protein